MKIYHAADIHLGRRRLDGRLPDDDIVAAFRFITEKAIREKADVFLVAGDLFDRPQVDPPHLRQAQEVLRRLKNASIPVIAMEGNHDKQFVNTDAPTWVRFLADDDLLMLLRPEFHPEGVRLNEWNTESSTGAWVEIGGVRFVGAGYESIKQQLHDAALKHITLFNREKNTAKLAKFDILLNHEICSFEEAVTCDEAELRQRIANRVERFSRSIHPEIISFFKKQVAKSKESS